MIAPTVVGALGTQRVRGRSPAHSIARGPRIAEERLAIGCEDALARQLEAFLHALDERELSLTRAADALTALQAAERVVAAMPRPRDLR